MKNCKHGHICTVQGILYPWIGRRVDLLDCAIVQCKKTSALLKLEIVEKQRKGYIRIQRKNPWDMTDSISEMRKRESSWSQGFPLWWLCGWCVLHQDGVLLWGLGSYSACTCELMRCKVNYGGLICICIFPSLRREDLRLILGFYQHMHWKCNQDTFKMRKKKDICGCWGHVNRWDLQDIEKDIAWERSKADFHVIFINISFLYKQTTFLVPDPSCTSLTSDSDFKDGAF